MCQREISSLIICVALIHEPKFFSLRIMLPPISRTRSSYFTSVTSRGWVFRVLTTLWVIIFCSLKLLTFVSGVFGELYLDVGCHLWYLFHILWYPLGWFWVMPPRNLFILLIILFSTKKWSDSTFLRKRKFIYSQLCKQIIVIVSL